LSRLAIAIYKILLLTHNKQASFAGKYSSEDGLHGPKHVVSEWKEIIVKNFVAIDGRYNKVHGTNLFPSRLLQPLTAAALTVRFHFLVLTGQCVRIE
jgi:hypothetical protein